MDSSLSGERNTQEKQKKRLSCNHQGFTFSAKKTKIGDKKKRWNKKGKVVTIGLTTEDLPFLQKRQKLAIKKKVEKKGKVLHKKPTTTTSLCSLYLLQIIVA